MRENVRVAPKREPAISSALLYSQYVKATNKAASRKLRPQEYPREKTAFLAAPLSLSIVSCMH